MSTTNIDALYNSAKPTVDLLGDAHTHVANANDYIDNKLPELKASLQADLAAANQHEYVTTEAKAEIQAAIDKIDANLA